MSLRRARSAGSGMSKTAVDGDERSVSPRRALVYEPGDDFFSGSRLTLQEDRRVGRRDAQGRSQDALPLRGAADHITPACCDVADLYTAPTRRKH
jgi:hypothetical protein